DLVEVAVARVVVVGLVAAEAELAEHVGEELVEALARGVLGGDPRAQGVGELVEAGGVALDVDGAVLLGGDPQRGLGEVERVVRRGGEAGELLAGVLLLGVHRSATLTITHGAAAAAATSA